MSELFVNIDFDHYREIMGIYYKDNNLDLESIEEAYEMYLQEHKNAYKQGNKNLIVELSRKLSIYQKAIELKEILEINFKEDEKFFIP
jgi:hypothetical protein